MAKWKDKHGKVRRVSNRDFQHNYFVEVCLRDWQSDEPSWDELEDYDRVLSSQLTEKEVMSYAVQC